MFKPKTVEAAVNSLNKVVENLRAVAQRKTDEAVHFNEQAAKADHARRKANAEARRAETIAGKLASVLDGDEG